MSKKTTSVASILGKSYAHIQHSIDLATSWSFQKLRDISSIKPKKKQVRQPMRFIRWAGSFLGETGNAFYEEYEALKQEKQMLAEEKKEPNNTTS